MLSQCDQQWDQQWVAASWDLDALGLNVPKLETLKKLGFGAFEELAAVDKLAQPAHPEEPWSKPCKRVVTALKAWITLVDQGGDADGAWDGLVSVARAVLVERAKWRAIFAASAKTRADSAKQHAAAAFKTRYNDARSFDYRVEHTELIGEDIQKVHESRREAWVVANQYLKASEQVAELAAQSAKQAEQAELAKQAVLAASRVTDAAKAAHDAQVAQRAADDATDLAESLIMED